MDSSTNQIQVLRVLEDCGVDFIGHYYLGVEDDPANGSVAADNKFSHSFLVNLFDISLALKLFIFAKFKVLFTRIYTLCSDQIRVTIISTS